MKFVLFDQKETLNRLRSDKNIEAALKIGYAALDATRDSPCHGR